VKSRERKKRALCRAPSPPGAISRRQALTSGLSATALLAGCARFDGSSWVSRASNDVDRRFRASLDELPSPRSPRLPSSGPWSFLVVSDLHSWDEVPATFAELEAVLEEHPVDFLFQLGDLADAGYSSEFAAGKRGFDALGLPVYWAMGNHDVYHEGWSSYRVAFGPSVYEMRVEGSVFLVLDTAGGTLGVPQRQWLGERLEQAAGADHIFVLTHYPIWPGAFAHVGQIASQQEVYDLFDLFRQHEVRAHISGHTHAYANSQLGDLELFTVASMSEGAPDRAALRVTVDGAEVRYAVHRLGVRR